MTQYNVAFQTNVALDHTLVFTILEGPCQGQKFYIDDEALSSNEQTGLLDCSFYLCGKDLGHTGKDIAPYVQYIIETVIKGNKSSFTK